MAEEKAPKAKKERRVIPGNLSYVPTPGGFARALTGIINAETPAKVDQNYIQTVLGIKGGTGTAQLPMLKNIGLVDANGKPTDLYSRFRSGSKRSAAALEALKHGYASVFAKNAYAHKLGHDELVDLIVEITGLTKEDSIVRCIYACFDKLRGYVTSDTIEEPSPEDKSEAKAGNKDPIDQGAPGEIRLNYVLNIVLPQSNSIETYNMIFRSLRENILDWQK